MERRPGKTTELDPRELESILKAKDSPNELRTYGSSSNLIRFDDSYWEIASALRNFSPQKRAEWFHNFVQYSISRNNHAFIAKAKRIHKELLDLQITMTMCDTLRSRWEQILEGGSEDEAMLETF